MHCSRMLCHFRIEMEHMVFAPKIEMQISPCRQHEIPFVLSSTNVSFSVYSAKAKWLKSVWRLKSPISVHGSSSANVFVCKCVGLNGYKTRGCLCSCLRKEATKRHSWPLNENRSTCGNSLILWVNKWEVFFPRSDLIDNWSLIPGRNIWIPSSLPAPIMDLVLSFWGTFDQLDWMHIR